MLSSAPVDYGFLDVLFVMPNYIHYLFYYIDHHMWVKYARTDQEHVQGKFHSNLWLKSPKWQNKFLKQCAKFSIFNKMRVLIPCNILQIASETLKRRLSKIFRWSFYDITRSEVNFSIPRYISTFIHVW